MKTLCKPLAITLALVTLHLSPFTFRLHASVPLAWEVRPGQPAPVMFDRYHGEMLSFSATFRGFGELPFSPGADVRLWYQTNGMGQAWWSEPATIQSNVLSATWSPALDPGADRVSLFFGAPSNAYAAAVLRLRHSPGFAPGAMPDPESFRESDPVFAAWLATYTPPDTSLEPSTNYTDRAFSSFAATGTVARASSYGTPTRWTDATGCVWEVGLARGGTPVSDTPGATWLYYEYWESEELGKAFMTLNGVGWEEYTNLDDGWESFTFDQYATRSDYGEGTLTSPVTFTRPLVLVTNLVGRVALTNDIPAETDPTVPEWAKEPSPPSYSASDVGAAPASLVQAVTNLQVESALVYRLYSGSNVVAEVTNYNSQVHAPELRLMQLNESNEYITVWTETNGLARTLRDATNYADRAIADHAAPRAWSATTSGLGADAPPNTTWVSTPRTVIAGGLEYAKIVDTYGEVWVLSSNGMAAEFNPDTNAYFRITADDGTDIFSIEKSDAQVVGVDADGITVGESSVTVPVGVVSAEHPTMYWRYSLDSGAWADESAVDPNYMSVDWTGGPGTWQCNIGFDGTRPSSMFFKFTYLQEGGVVIRNHAASDISAGIYVNGVKFVPSVSGNNLIWTKQQ